MSKAENVAHGFLVTAGVICLFATAGWQAFYSNLWADLLLFLLLAVPISIQILMVLEDLEEKRPTQTKVKQTKSILMALQGVGFACWFLDIISTIFTVNINQTGSELNPLGWPLSALGGLAYYVPITFVVYYLLYQDKSKETFYGAVALTAITLFMSARNLNAGLHNFIQIASFSSSTAESEIVYIWIVILFVLGISNTIIMLRNRMLRNRALRIKE